MFWGYPLFNNTLCICSRYVDPEAEGMTQDQLRDIPYTTVEYVTCLSLILGPLGRYLFTHCM